MTQVTFPYSVSLVSCEAGTQAQVFLTAEQAAWLAALAETVNARAPFWTSPVMVVTPWAASDAETGA